MKKNTFIYIALCSLGFIACDPDFDQELEDTPIAVQESGTADFSNYVALGNSLTAGFADGALYRSGQETSFPNILATQMQAANGNQPFNIPFMPDDVGGFAGFEDAFPTRFVFDATNRAPTRLNNNVAANDITARVEGTFNNFGVPGITSFQLGFEGLGNPAGLQTTPVSANPYFVRFASSPTASILGDALATNPTFFTLWLGNNDILSYAVSGGTGEDQTGNPDPTTYGPNDITDPTLFAGTYQAYITAINGATTAANTVPANGVVINIPSVTNIPFFTTVPNNALVLTAEQAAGLTGFFQLYSNVIFNGILATGATPEQAATIASQYAIPFTEGANRFLISVPETDSNPQGFRQMNINERLLLTIDQNALRQEGLGSALITDEIAAILQNIAINGPTAFDPADAPKILAAVNPIADEDALDTSELNAIETARTAYNAVISQVAQNNDNIALFNVSRRLAELQQGGVNTQDLTLTADFVTGGAFSLDGIHLSPRGYAVIANDIIEVINRNFNSTLQPVNVSQFRTVTLQ